MKARESLSQGGVVFALVEEVAEPVIKKSKKQPDFVTLQKRKEAAKKAAKKAKLPKKPSNHTKIIESRNNLAVEKWMKQIISQQTRIISDNAKFANRIRHNPKFLPKRTVGNARPAEIFNQPEVQTAAATAAATPLTPAEARRSANQMSRQINDMRESQGLRRRGRPPGSRRTTRGTEVSNSSVIPGLANLGLASETDAALPHGGFIEEYVTPTNNRRPTPRRMLESDGSGFSSESE